MQGVQKNESQAPLVRPVVWLKLSLALVAILNGCSSAPTPAGSPSHYLATWHGSLGATGYLVFTNGVKFGHAATNGFWFLPLPTGTTMFVEATNATQISLPSNVIKL